LSELQFVLRLTFWISVPDSVAQVCIRWRHSPLLLQPEQACSARLRISKHGRRGEIFISFHQFSQVCGLLLKVNAVQTKYDIYWGAIAGLKKSP
jgi:hypothetical protein